MSDDIKSVADLAAEHAPQSFWIAASRSQGAHAVSACCAHCDAEESFKHRRVWTQFFVDKPAARVVCHRCGYVTRLVTSETLRAKLRDPTGSGKSTPLPPELEGALVGDEIEIIFVEEPEAKA